MRSWIGWTIRSDMPAIPRTAKTRGEPAQFLPYVYRQDGIPLYASGGSAIDTYWDLAHQRDPVKLALEVGVEYVCGRKMGGGSVIPERNATRFPLEPDRVFWANHVLPQQLEQSLALPGCQSHNRGEESGAHIEHTLPGLGMYCDQGMLADEHSLAQLLIVLFSGLLTRGLKAVNATQPVHKTTQRRRQSLIGGREVGKLGIASIGGHFHTPQNRGCRRVVCGRNVSVPTGPGRDQGFAPEALRAAMFCNRVYLWIIFKMSKDRMSDRQLPELSGKCNVLTMIEMLFTEEDDFPLQEGIANFLDHVRREWAGQIDATNLGTDKNRKRPYLDRVRQSRSSGLGPGI